MALRGSGRPEVPYKKVVEKKIFCYELYLGLGPSGTLKGLRKLLDEEHNVQLSLAALQGYSAAEDWTARRKAFFKAEKAEQLGFNARDPLASVCIRGKRCVAQNGPYTGWGVRQQDGWCPECSAASWSQTLT
jgi:hypothetical protein